MFEVHEERIGAELVVSIAGELDPSTAPYLHDRIYELELDDVSLELVTADLSELDFLDSAGIGTLVELRERTVSGGCRLRLVNVRPAQLRIFRITGLIDALGVEVPR